MEYTAGSIPRLSIFVEQEGERFRARCPQFSLVATGRTAQEAHEAMLAMIEEYMNFTDPQSWLEYMVSLQDEWEEDMAESPLPPGPRVIN
jgi:hypothetical protein